MSRLDGQCWPDGLPVHDLLIYVRLGCGHERVSRGWRGHEGATFCCDHCHQLTTMTVVEPTTEPESGWREAPA